jgi:hypothetical protein
MTASASARRRSIDAAIAYGTERDKYASLETVALDA